MRERVVPSLTTLVGGTGTPTFVLLIGLLVSMGTAKAAQGQKGSNTFRAGTDTRTGVVVERYLERITVKKDSPHAYFTKKAKDHPFLVKGFNYVPLRGGDHAAFDAATTTTEAHYNPKRVENMLSTMEKHGYNTVRVFIIGRSKRNPGIGGNYKATRGTYAPYVRNFIDFLKRATRHGIYVLPTFGDGDLPENQYYQRMLPPEHEGTTPIYFTREGIEAKKQYVTDFLRAIKQKDPKLISGLLGVELQNELSVRDSEWPFNVTNGTVTVANGNTYDMSSASDRRRLMNEGLRYYHNELVDAIKEVDPELLVAEGVFTMQAVGKSLKTHRGLFPDSSRHDDRYPPDLAALGQSDLDFIDVHYYKRKKKNTLNEHFHEDMASLRLWSDQMRPIRKKKPIILGEFGAWYKIQGPSASARRAMLAIRNLALEAGFSGYLFWTYDTFAQEHLMPALELGDSFIQDLGH